MTAVIGTGRRIGDVINSVPNDNEIAALADCDTRQMGTGSKFGQRMWKQFPKIYDKLPRCDDHRKMLDEEKGLDATFLGDDEASRNRWVSRPRRKGYELPQV